MAYLVFDPVSGEGLAGNAGHPPPLLMSRDAPPRLDLGEAGTPLGWASPRQQYVFRLPPGNTAVLYSDGLVENRRSADWTQGSTNWSPWPRRSRRAWRRIRPGCLRSWSTGCSPAMSRTTT